MKKTAKYTNCSNLRCIIVVSLGYRISTEYVVTEPIMQCITSLPCCVCSAYSWPYLSNVACCVLLLLVDELLLMHRCIDQECALIVYHVTYVTSLLSWV